MRGHFPLGNMITPTHFVRFYDDDTALIEELTYFFKAGLVAGQAAIVIATKPHRDALEQRLTAGGYDLAAYHRRGQYVPLDAAATLSNIMVNDWPNEQRFHEVVGNLIAQADARHLWVRAFGEMVAVLWAEGKREAALHLEKLWNRLSERHSFSLYCAYPTGAFDTASANAGFKDICMEHMYVLLPDRQRDSAREPSH